ncbi:MAG: hypothetical protein EBU33_05405 [Sphingobacteriia bacterium]|nr:hypothetical protein [Sphingobacteriia bacterium]
MLKEMSQPVHICFYSNRCDWSKAFIEEISKTNYHKDFRFICVDPSPQRPALPSWLKQAPTLVISGEPEPRTNSEVMNWLYEQKLKDGGKKGGQGAQGGAQAGPMEPEPYLDMEMGGGFGDSYSFLGTDTSAQGDGGLSMKHSFGFLNGQDAPSTREASTFQMTSSNQKRSKKEEMLDAQISAYKENRDIGLPKRISRQ